MDLSILNLSVTFVRRAEYEVSEYAVTKQCNANMKNNSICYNSQIVRLKVASVRITVSHTKVTVARLWQSSFGAMEVEEDCQHEQNMSATGSSEAIEISTPPGADDLSVRMPLHDVVCFVEAGDGLQRFVTILPVQHITVAHSNVWISSFDTVTSPLSTKPSCPLWALL